MCISKIESKLELLMFDEIINMNSEFLTNRKIVLFTGKGNQGKSIFSKRIPLWIKEDENSITIWSNEDNVDEKPKESGFVKYHD